MRSHIFSFGVVVFCLLVTNYSYFIFIVTFPHSIIHISCPKKRTSTGFFTNWQAMHLSDKCADLLVGSCSQSLQTSDFHLLIYAPLRGAEYFSANARNKKKGHPTECDSDEMPLGTIVSLLMFLFFLSPWFPLLFQDSGIVRCRILP